MKAGRTRNACSILVSKARPVSPAATSSPAGAAGLHGRPQRPCRQEAEQGEEGIRVVEAEHQDGDWREGERQGGKVRCHVPGPPPHQAVQDEDRGDAGGGLGQQQQHAPRGEPEDPGREDLHPQGGRRLVDGDEVAGVDRAEEERLRRSRSRRRGLAGGLLGCGSVTTGEGSASTLKSGVMGSTPYGRHGRGDRGDEHAVVGSTEEAPDAVKVGKAGLEDVDA